MMRKITLMAVGIFLLTATTHALALNGGTGVKVALVDAQGLRVGTATLTQLRKGVRIKLEVFNMPPGVHAFHIHAVGKCDPPDFKSAGGHFNPAGKKHGHKNPEGAHAGDLPNLVVDQTGTGSLITVAQGVTLGEGKNSLFQPEGTSLVIHEKEDDEMTDPAGNAGARIACGVIAR